ALDPLHPEDLGVKAQRLVHVDGRDADVVEAGRSHGRVLGVTVTRPANLGGRMATYRIPFESLDPLTIGAAGDESKIYREELELEIPDGNLLAAIYPDEPEPVGDATEAARTALESPVSGPRFSELLAGATKVAVV